MRNYDLSRFVYEWLLSCIKKFKDSTKVASKRSVTFGGCHYAFAVSVVIVLLFPFFKFDFDMLYSFQSFHLLLFFLGLLP